MKEIDGFWWPDGDTVAHKVIPGMLAGAIDRVLARVPGRALAVQAGGNAGWYPAALAVHFDMVLTFEPDPENFACLQRNLADHRNVVAEQLALGAAEGTAGLGKAARQFRAGRVTPTPDPSPQGGGEQEVTVIPLDGLSLKACDLIWLDVNGGEADALWGARQTIIRLRPVIVIAELARDSGVARGRLESIGYRAVTRVPARDLVMVAA